MKKLLLVAAVALALSGCTDEQGAAKTLAHAGYTDVKFHGHSWFGCSDDDTYATEFSGKDLRGVYTEGVVCKGLWGKNSTIRTDD